MKLLCLKGVESAGRVPSVRYTLTFSLQLRNNQGKTCHGIRKVRSWTVLGTVCYVDLDTVLQWPQLASCPQLAWLSGMLVLPTSHLRTQ